MQAARTHSMVVMDPSPARWSPNKAPMNPSVGPPGAYGYQSRAPAAQPSIFGSHPAGYGAQPSPQGPQHGVQGAPPGAYWARMAPYGGQPGVYGVAPGVDLTQVLVHLLTAQQGGNQAATPPCPAVQCKRPRIPRRLGPRSVVTSTVLASEGSVVSRSCGADSRFATALSGSRSSPPVARYGGRDLAGRCPPRIWAAKVAWFR